MELEKQPQQTDNKNENNGEKDAQQQSQAQQQGVKRELAEPEAKENNTQESKKQKKGSGHWGRQNDNNNNNNYNRNNNRNNKPKHQGGRKKEDDDEDREVSNDPNKRQFPKRKVAILLAYNGSGYQGLQKNPGALTIEEELEKAILNIGGMLPSNFGDLHKTCWQRCARTDKGVHAAFQIVNLKILLVGSDAEIVEKLNQQLPPAIRVFGIARVARSFGAKESCSARTYEYILPTSVFRPRSPSALTRATAAPSTSQDSAAIASSSPSAPTSSTPTSLAPTLTDPTSSTKNESESSWTFSQAKDKISATLKTFEGTHNFHNFTVKTKGDDKSASRFIIYAKCGEPFRLVDQEWVSIEIKGQSFMLNQIRKMVAMLILVVRDDIPIDVMPAAMSKAKQILPIAPALGLVLKQCHFEFYETKFPTHDNLRFEAVQDKLAEFKIEKIFSALAETEKNEKILEQWARETEPLDYNGIMERGKDAAQKLDQERRDKAQRWRNGGQKETKYQKDDSKKQNDDEKKASDDMEGRQQQQSSETSAANTAN